MFDGESINDGKKFIQTWLANLSPQERESLEASFRECLPMLKEIEAARRAVFDAHRNDSPAVGLDRVCSSIDEIEDFQTLANVIGIDPENLTAGDVVAIALEWVGLQETGIEREKVMTRLRQFRSKSSRQTALENLAEDAMMNHIDIAAALDLPPESLKSRLDRWRHENVTGWRETPLSQSNEPRFVYQVGAIRPVLMEAIVASYRPPHKSDSSLSNETS